MTVRKYVIRRLILALVTLIGVSVTSFLLVNVVPGDPVRAILGPFATPELVARLTAKMGLDRPLPEQYIRYMSRVLQGDLGQSYRTQNSVLQDIAQRWPATLELVLLAFLLALVVGIALGVGAALKRNGPLDYLCTLIGVTGISIPVFWMGLVLLIIFFVKLGWAPAPIGRVALDMRPPQAITGFYTIDSILTANWAALRSSLAHLALPVISLCLLPLAPITRMTRSSMIEVLHSDYVRAARIAGLSEAHIVLRIAFRNALIPIVTLVGVLLGYMISGSVLVETVFSWPGLGFYLTRALTSLDYQPVQGIILLVGAMFVFLNLTVDLLYFVIDPRIRVS
jgi:peptide/nickel transport system permease protein